MSDYNLEEEDKAFEYVSNLFENAHSNNVTITYEQVVTAIGNSRKFLSPSLDKVTLNLVYLYLIQNKSTLTGREKA